MRPEGRGTSGILAIGEALGENEAKDGLPFRPYAEAGSVLERALWRAGVTRDSLTLSNLVWYQPPRNWLDGAPWEMEAIRACRPYNDKLVEAVQPKVILALGGLPFRELTGMSGKKQGIGLCRGFVVDGLQYPGIPVVGTYHPSFLRRGSKERQREQPGSKVGKAGGGTQGMALLGTLIRDIQLCKDIAARGKPKFIPKHYQMQADLDRWRFALSELRKAGPDWPVFYDFEGAKSLEVDEEHEVEEGDWQPTQVQICYGQTCVVSEWHADLIRILGQILELPNPKIDWYGRGFDRPLLQTLGLRCDIGEWHDLQDFWHWVQPDLPRGLQYAASFFCPEAGPWKHLSAVDPHWYGALDVDMPSRIWEGLRRYAQTQINVSSGRSMQAGYEEQVAQLSPVLDGMQARGMPVDDTRRQLLHQEFSDELEQICTRLQAMVPDECKNIHPEGGYQRKHVLPQACLEAAGQSDLFGNGHQRAEKVVAEDGRVFVLRQFKVKDGTTERWAELLPFLPNSSDQMLAYIKWQMKHSTQPKAWKVPINHKTGSESTVADELERLYKATQDPVLKAALECRELAKARGTYAAGDWIPGPDGRVHPFFQFKPATGQLSSQSPNAQNFPKHSPKLAKAMGKMIAAQPGHTLVVADYKGFHILTLGFESQDPLYIRLGRIDMHSFFTLCGMLRLEKIEKVVGLQDAELADLLSWYRYKDKREYADYGGRTFERIRDEIAKHAILAYGNGQTAHGLFRRNPEAFPTLKFAEKCQAELDATFPKPKQWKKDIAQKADRQTYLLSRFGSVRRFWDVFQRKPVAANYQPRPGQQLVENGNGQRWILLPGDDHEAAISCLIQNDAFGVKRRVMVEMGKAGLDAKYGLITEIHDSLVFECPNKYLDEALPEIKRRMEAPCPLMVDPVVAPGGFWAGVDIQVGPDLADLKKVKVQI
jgi:uracil-DNA glycosylase family 4